LFSSDARRSLLTIEGPVGRFIYRERDAPMLLVGGGTGLAPLKSIVRHVVENGLKRAMTLYWGVRSRADLYAHQELRALAQRTPSLRYEPVLSEPDPGWTGRRGFVHEAVLDHFDGLDTADVYASGPPAMIDAVRREFGRRGVDASRLFCDSFDYAPDSLERQRRTAATKS
jgi:CDP-4-dehydro-6-deoxyglucose reductase